ncbi:MAG: hypothetical protein M1546_13935 [Chloroflexi bacterium]|nr:hypothetical protein [Chloroflexota bacterium]
MASEAGHVMHDDVEQMHLKGLQVAERLDPTLCTLLTDLARAKGLSLPEPVAGVIHRDRPGRDHRYAVWQLSRDRGAFLAKVELFSDTSFSFLYLKASLQSRFWEREAQRFGELLCKSTGLQVELERTQSDGIISYSATWSPETFAGER